MLHAGLWFGYTPQITVRSNTIGDGTALPRTGAQAYPGGQ
jgi:hypothetical protein